MACTEKLYIESATSLKERLDRYDQIIEALELQSIEAAANSDIDEYELDDGQVKIKTKYRTLTSITNAINNFTRLRNKCYNQLNGRVGALRNVRGLK